MATKMNLKFDKYWCKFSTIMAIAVIFYPRYKFHIIEWAYKKIYGSSSDLELDLFKGKLFSLFEEYESMNEKSKGVESSSSKVDKTVDSYMTDFDDFFSCEFTSGDKSELESYLEEPKLPRVGDLNVLEYWKALQG
ncbi:hypothetical protein LXL04_002621 [Taraxacum kok-saghyz]